jgi:alkylhydroperoxidase/carboxymuconolactone decarboxylase family protein YurZ
VLDASRRIALESADVVPAEIRADWKRYLTDTVLDGIWERPALPPRDRSFITVAALATLQCRAELRMQLRIALEHGLSRAELCELMLQVAGYAGLGAGHEAVVVLEEVFASESVATDDRAGSVDESLTGGVDERVARGAAMISRLNPEITVPTRAEQRQLVDDWMDWLIGTAFGELWSRPNLTLVERERVTLAVLIVRGQEGELRSHIPIALHLGIDPAEIGEIIMHLGVYAGFPTAVSAMRTARDVIEEREGR